MRRPVVASLAAALLVVGCSEGTPGSAGPSPSSPSRSSASTPSPTVSSPAGSPTRGPSEDPGAGAGTPGPVSRDGTLSSAAYGPGSTPPPWLFERVLPEGPDGFGAVRPTPPRLRRRAFTLPDTVPMLPGSGYASRVVSPAPRSVIDRSTWRPRCPVRAEDLAWLRVVFWGFDARRHTGELLVHARVARDVDRVFGRLWRARFPLEQVLVVRSVEEDAPPTGDGNGTGGFVCRATTGGTSFSQHAYGLALDVNAFQNPYLRDGLVLPERASAYLDRERVRPGMITGDGPVVAAFRAIGWEWGGDWSTLKDYQHFSESGR